jgi:hypothetical protein
MLSVYPKKDTGTRLTHQNTHLDRHTLSLCVSLIENGVNPEALAVRDEFNPLLWEALEAYVFPGRHP